jgi:hypothetical protein
MLKQLLEAQGADVTWHVQLPEGSADLKGNQKAAAYISSFSRRPGRRLKHMRDRLEELAAKDHVAPTSLAAVLRKDGKAAFIDFPLLRERVRVRRVKKSTRCYNKMVACTEVAMVERRRVIDFVERKLRCRCGAFLHFDRARSQQVGVCAAWQFQCQKSCNIPPLHTSAQVHGDDYELNAKLNYAISTCALSFARMVPFLFFLGMGAPSNADHYATKAEITPILANAAERSMAEAHARNVVAGDTEFISFDGGFTAPRNAHGCTGAAHAKDSAIIEIVHRRLTDVGAKTSKSLEVLCYTALLCCPRVHIYATVVMDGCRELVRPTHAAGKRAQGDMWHSGKNWSKWYEPAGRRCSAGCRKRQPKLQCAWSRRLLLQLTASSPTESDPRTYQRVSLHASVCASSAARRQTACRRPHSRRCLPSWRVHMQ